MLETLGFAAAGGAGVASVMLAWRALRELVRGAREDAHGTARASRRLWAHRMRLFAFTGVAAVLVGALAAARRGIASGGGVAAAGALQLSVGMLLAGLLAWVSARASGRASRRGDKRSHVHARIRFQRWREQQQRRRQRRRSQHGEAKEGPRRRGRREEHRKTPRSRRQREVRRALRTLELSDGATRDEIKRAWREQVFRHHPDRHASAGDDTRAKHAEAFREAQHAYETLLDEGEANRR